MRRWADKATEIIVKHYDPDKIILFGSYAKGKETLNSDIDLLIVKDVDLPRNYRGLDLIDYLSKYPVIFDLLFYTHSEIEQAMAIQYSFIRSILETGVFLYIKT